MARAKKEHGQPDDCETTEPKNVRVFSQRKGDIILKDATVLKCNDVLLVTDETASWLEASFKGLVKRID